MLAMAKMRRLERWSDEARILRRIVARGRLQAGLFRPRLIDVLVRAGEHEAAYREVNAMVAAGTSRAASGLLLEMAWHFRDAGVDDRAEELFRRALEVPRRTAPSLGPTAEDPEVVSRQAALAVAHLYAEDAERERLVELATGSDASSDDPFVLYERGTQYLTSGDLERAFDLLTEAAPGLPELEAAWYNLALVAYRLKRWEPAADAYARANQLNPERADGWFFQGLALVNLERCQEALEPLSTALRLDPERALAHYHLAECYLRLGRDQEAAPHRRAWVESRDEGEMR